MQAAPTIPSIREIRSFLTRLLRMLAPERLKKMTLAGTLLTPGIVLRVVHSVLERSQFQPQKRKRGKGGKAEAPSPPLFPIRREEKQAKHRLEENRYRA